VTGILAMVWPDLRAPDPAPELLAAYQPMLDALDDFAPRVEVVDVGVALVDVGCIHAVGSGRTMGQQ
jgi:hypothetical protein